MISSELSMQVVGLGATTAVGRDVWSTAAAVRAGVAGFQRHGFMVDDVGRPLTVAAMPGVGDDRSVAQRMSLALESVIDEATKMVTGSRSPSSLQLVVNLPSARPGLPVDLAMQVKRMIDSAFPGRFRQVAVGAGGHAGGLVALTTARSWLADDPTAAVVVAGVDSYLDPDMLEWLDRTGQLHGAGRRNNAWGFVPGEGAGAIVLMRAGASDVADTEGTSFGRVLSVGVGSEERLIGTGEVCTGTGLTRAVRLALGELPVSETLSDVYCDMNGEPYRADEYAFVVARTSERFASASAFQAPADCWGDVGAASGPLLLALACVAGVKRYARGGRALVWASSVRGERAAVVIERPATAMA